MKSVAASEVRKFVALSLDNGAVSPERVQAVLATLGQMYKPAKLRSLLKAYYTAIRREITHGEARIEYAGALAETAPALIAAHFSKVYGRPILPLPLENPALIVGMRVRVGDDVYDASARNTLERLAAQLA